MVFKTFERIVSKFSKGTVRWPAVLDVFTAQPSLYYSCIVMMHYQNDFWYMVYSSQLFFVLTEAFVFCTIVVLLDRRKLVPAAVWYAAAGSAAYHICQLELDEWETIIRGVKLGRSVHMLLGDVVNFAVLWSVGQSWHSKESHSERRTWNFLAGVAAVVSIEWLVFSSAFVDGASNGTLSQVGFVQNALALVHRVSAMG